MQNGAAVEQMVAVERQMQDLLTRMQGVNQSIAAQHLEATNSKSMHLLPRLAKASFGRDASQQPAEWPAKLDFSFLHQKVIATHSSVAFPAVIHISLHSRHHGVAFIWPQRGFRELAAVVALLDKQL